MRSFRMSWFLTIIVLSFTFNSLSEAMHEKQLPSAVQVVGSVYCDTCFQGDFSKTSHFISGALVAVECEGESFYNEVKTNKHGEFKVHLPFSFAKHVKKIKGCSVKLISSSEPSCAVASTKTSSSLLLKSRKQGTHIFSAGFFTFKPPKRPTLICSQNPSVQKSKEFNSKKSLIPTAFGIPLPPNPLLPPPSILPPFPNPFQPPPSIIPPFPNPFQPPPSPPSILPPFPNPFHPPPSPPSILPPIPIIIPPIPGLAQPPPLPPAPPAFPIPLPPLPFLPPPSILPPLPPLPFLPPPSILPPIPNPFQPPPSPPSILPPIPIIIPPIPGLGQPPPLPPAPPAPPAFPIPLPPLPFLPPPLIPPASSSSTKKSYP